MMAPTDHPSASGHLFAQAYLIHHLLKPALAALLTLLLFGCKLVVTVPEGGRVVTEDGFVCVGPAECVIEVTTDDFDSVFTAEPARGYTFTQWAKKKSSFCGHKTTPCPLSTKGFSAKQILMDVLASDREFYLEPIFVQYDVAYWRRVLAEIDQGSFSTASYLYGATPDVGNCGPGSLNPAPKARAEEALDQTRSLHELPPVDYDAFYDMQMQETSLCRKPAWCSAPTITAITSPRKMIPAIPPRPLREPVRPISVPVPHPPIPPRISSAGPMTTPTPPT
jgi:hypothetical protein